mmetsp:Transcript_151527/g.264710  ORF Transcript_151527/g.264710 Transcript_151527/m.264710 type:complete len:225 (-) Transcript_151527:1063-1737(-)
MARGQGGRERGQAGGSPAGVGQLRQGTHVGMPTGAARTQRKGGPGRMCSEQRVGKRCTLGENRDIGRWAAQIARASPGPPGGCGSKTWSVCAQIGLGCLADCGGALGGLRVLLRVQATLEQGTEVKGNSAWSRGPGVGVPKGAAGQRRLDGQLIRKGPHKGCGCHLRSVRAGHGAVVGLAVGTLDGSILGAGVNRGRWPFNTTCSPYIIWQMGTSVPHALPLKP